MDHERRKQLREQYKEIKTYMGIIKIQNTSNGKIYIDTCSNLKNRWLSIQDQLASGRHINSQLQKDWNTFGPEAFTYEVLEEKDTEDITDIKWELKQMEKQWLEKLQPFGDSGYNKLK